MNVRVKNARQGQVKVVEQAVNRRRMKPRQKELEVAPRLLLERIQVT